MFPLINVIDYSFRYALCAKPALSGINFSAREGEFILLCGPSGCGKTTLLRQLKPELAPSGESRGKILFEGHEIGALGKSDSACGIGFVMQNPESQIVCDAVWQELAFGLENLGVESGEIRRRVAEISSFFGIGNWFHKKTDELSGGQKQMLNLAAILIMQPRLLLLDEPFSMLDPMSSREFAQMVARLNRELGITIVMAAHRLDEVFHLANRAVFMDGGKIVCDAPPRQLVQTVRENPAYLSFMPASVRIFSAVSAPGKESCPITVREGKTWLKKQLGGEKPVEMLKDDRQNPACKAAVECKNLFFRYAKDSPDVLRRLSMRAAPGELLCILGENGSGKSTLLNLLAGLLTAQHGDIFAGGKSLRKLSARARYLNNIALLPQNPKALFACDNLLDDLKAAARQAGTESEIGETVASLALGGLTGRHPYDLSGGEFQRAAIAKLLLVHPKILMLDEATKGLDAQARTELAKILRGLCETGVCVILVTHDVEFAAENASRCLLLFDGTVACEGAPRGFFGGNFFYTTAANRIAREFDRYAVTCGDVVNLCEKG